VTRPVPFHFALAVLRALVGAFCLLTATGATATPGSAELVCDQAAQTAALESGVPVQILRAVTRTETGRTVAGTFGPWPWTVNHAGDGHWFDRTEDALRYIRDARRSGAQNFDVGCFQINYRWHGEAFASLEDMLDPIANARYAATFLTELRAELGSWDGAVAAFHSRTPEFAARYMERFRRIYAGLSPPSGPASAGSRPAPGAPQALDLSRRASLYAPSRIGLTHAASLFRPSPARPLWEHNQ
jgi:hypothetical protein